AGYVWYSSRPKPHYVASSVTSPALTEYNESGVSRIYPLRVSFTEAAAPLKQVEKRITAGVAINPALTRSWFLVRHPELQFTPKDDWPIDVAFTVRFDRKLLLDPAVQLQRYSFDFRSQPFSTRISESQFYQDPRDPNLKKLVATVRFSHPVDPPDF